MKSCLVFSVPRSGTHMLMKMFDLLGCKAWWCHIGGNIEIVFDMPKAGHYCFPAHLESNKKWCDKLTSSGLKGVYITREPKDVAVSMAVSGAKNTGEELCDHHIADVLKILKSEYERRNGWALHPQVYHTAYEKLVGSKGGGSDEIQISEIKAITEFLQFDVSKEALSACAADLYGPGNSKYPSYFSAGIIGNWARHWNDELEDVYQEYNGGP